MVVRVEVNPEFFPWAIERARGDPEEFAQRFPKLPEWIAGEAQPTLKQLEKFAAATHAPVGFFFLPEPPKEPLPIADFRTLGGAAVESPSADLLDTIYVCQQRQEWYRDFARTAGEAPLRFVGTLTTATPPSKAARVIREALQFDLEARKRCPTWTEALRQLVTNGEDAGILVMISGIVGSNTTRVLNPEEFRGFCLVDDRAPVVFVNGADSKSAQMFTLMHEVAHLWLGSTGLCGKANGSSVESWCDQVARELLTTDCWTSELSGDSSEEPVMPWGVGDRFVGALLTDTSEGATPYRDACRLLGVVALPKDMPERTSVQAFTGPAAP